MAFLKILGDFFEFVYRALSVLVQLAHRILQAMVDMVLNEDLLGLGNGTLDRMQLLGQFKAGTMFFHHCQDAAQMAFSSLKALGDGIVMMMRIGFVHGAIISPPGGYD